MKKEKIETQEDYIQSLKELDHQVYYRGDRVADVTEHPAIIPHINAAAMTYELARDPMHRELMTAASHLTGHEINRFTHIHQSIDDLLKKVRMLRLLSHKTGSCYQRCVGLDGLNALYSVTFEMDQKHGTGYHKKFRDFLQEVQDRNVMVVGAMTDVKGDRSLAPSAQDDPDLYVHVVDRRNDGIVIRGAKAHQTGAVNSHEILVMPTITLRERDKDFAVAVAVPADAPGVIMIFGRQTNDDRKMQGEIDIGNARFSLVGGEALVVFEDVFVPWERVFMCGECDFSGLLVERFATYHRQNYGACKGGLADVLIGACALAVEQIGVAGASHVRDKIAEMIHLTETVYACSVACSAQGYRTPSGAYYADPLLANACKHNITRVIYELGRLGHDLAGGVIATLPSEQDLHSRTVGRYVEKYFKGVKDVPTEERIRILRLIENMTGGTALAESMHGAGSPQAQRIMYLRLGNLEQKKKLARRLAGIKDVE
ncbi:MAG: 4-hydroxyphenylacetate 3-hydroxylase family protein [Deltaproteobacteria bacterium]|nr:4-hydroxyphenylacetate 3-hydroxylase family protein [Deltaproteobacteria bacterium]